MQCKKCGNRLIADYDHMRASCKGGDVAQISTEVHRCPICGWRSYPEVQVAMPLTPELTGKHQQLDRGPKISEQIYQQIRQFYPDILWLRQAKTTWKAIASLITQATGRPIKADTVIKYFEMIQQEAKIHGAQRDLAAKPSRTEPVPVGTRQQLASGIRG